MKISEAMRRGIEQRPVQGYGMLTTGTDTACAVGAIMTGLGLVGENGSAVIGYQLQEAAPSLFKFRHADHIETIWAEITYMNDKQKKTREQIADWLESIGE